MLMCHSIVTLILISLVFCVNSMSPEFTEKKFDAGLQDRFTAKRIDDDRKLSKGAYTRNDLEEGRGWKKTALPFLLGITLKMTTLLPMISSLMTVVGGIALMASKLALLISIGLAVHYYMATKHQTQYYRQPLSHPQIYDTVLPATPYPVSHRLSVQST